MSLAAIFPPAVIETILVRIAMLFMTGAAGDVSVARQAATQALAAFQPQTEEELFLAATIVGFSLQALEALGQATAPDMSLTRILRLRGGAVSLSREAEKARRALAQLQKARHSVQPEAKSATAKADLPVAKAAPLPQSPARPRTDQQPKPEPMRATHPQTSPVKTASASPAALLAGYSYPAPAYPQRT